MTKDEERAYKRAYYLKNREEIIARVRRNTLKNAERVAMYQREYRLKNAEKLQAYKEANKERTAARDKERYYRDVEASRARVREWYWNNVDTVRASHRAYMRDYIRRPETRPIIRHNQRIREWRERGAAGRATRQQVQDRWDFYGGCCAYCGDPATTMDHVIPIARGGTNWPANLRPACHSCNSSKRDLSLATFLERILNV